MPGWRQILVVLLLVTLLHECVFADDRKPPVADALWIEPYQDGHRLNISHYDGEQWAEPAVVHKSKKAITSPAIATDSSGAKLVLWSELARGKSILMQREKSGGAADWSTPEVFSDFGSENLGAFIIIDLTGTTWVFWSANIGDLDDIYYVKKQRAGWSEPQRVNKKNDVPDFRPRAALSDQGDLIVQWKTYDFSVGQYVDAERTFKLDNSPESGYKSQLDVPVNEVPMPAFLPSNRTSIVHFPENKFLQSVLVE